MRPTHKLTRLALAVATALTVAGCGGGGAGSDTAGPAVAAPSSVTISGVAASGAAFVGAVVSVTDCTGAHVGTSVPVGADGTYSVTLAPGAKAPFVLVAERRDPMSGEVESLVSVQDVAATSTVNVTSVTTLIASRLSASGDPLKLADEVKSGAATVDTASVASKVAEVKAILRPVLAATGNTNLDPIKDKFAADGSGADRLLDSITVAITPSSATTTNVEIGFKQASSDPSVQPAVVRFDNTKTLADIKDDASNRAVITAPIDPATLVASGTNALVADFTARWTACYALPLTSRVASAAATAAADIVAPACRTLFVDDDPATYESDGAVVGKGLAFGGIYSDASTGTVFDQGSFEYTRSNGDIVIGYRSLSAAGVEAFGTLSVRNSGGQLKAIGNQYAYQGGVNARLQLRQYPTLDQSRYANYSVGYVLAVNDKLVGGVSVFDRVEVTTPDGEIFTLKPMAGTSSLMLSRESKVYVTNMVRLRAENIDPTVTLQVATSEPSLFFSAVPRTDADIAAMPAQAVWKFAYFLKTDIVNADAVQFYKTRARALTIAEFKTKPLPRLTVATVAALQALADPVRGAIPSGTIPLDAPTATVFGWVNPDGALPVSSLTMTGNKYDAGSGAYQMAFNDSLASIAPATTTGVMTCQVHSSGDTHCGAAPGSYVQGDAMTTIGLLAQDRFGRNFYNNYVTVPLVGK